MNVDQRDSLIHFLSQIFGRKEINEYLCTNIIFILTDKEIII